MSALQKRSHQPHTSTPDVEPAIGDMENELHDLSLRDVLQAHKDWRTQLELDIESSRLHQLDAISIARDDLCPLGRWLLGPGRQRFGNQPAWAAACHAHAELHHCAGDLLRARLRGDDSEKLTNLGYRLHDASSRNQLELVRLFTTAQH